jgi:hypothetical protein
MGCSINYFQLLHLVIESAKSSTPEFVLIRGLGSKRNYRGLALSNFKKPDRGCHVDG